MPRRLPLTVLASTGLIALSLGCAVPAMAATPAPAAGVSAPPAPSSTTKGLLTPVLYSQSISGGDGNNFGRSVSLNFKGATPESFYEVTNETTGDSNVYEEVNELGRFSFSIAISPGVHNDIKVVLTNPADPSEQVTLHFDVDDTRPDLVAPTVTTATAGSLSRITVSAPPLDGDTYLHVKDQQGHFLAVQQMTGGTASVVLPNTGSETHYFVSQYNRLVSSPATEVVIDKGAGTAMPAAPAVDVTTAGSTMIAQATGEKGATVTLRDAKGTAVAVRVLGTSGTVSFPLPKSVDGATLKATQSRGQLVSAPVDVSVPTR